MSPLSKGRCQLVDREITEWVVICDKIHNIKKFIRRKGEIISCENLIVFF